MDTNHSAWRPQYAGRELPMNVAERKVTKRGCHDHVEEFLLTQTVGEQDIHDMYAFFLGWCVRTGIMPVELADFQRQMPSHVKNSGKNEGLNEWLFAATRRYP